jgi:hypothetical protein
MNLFGIPSNFEDTHKSKFNFLVCKVVDTAIPIQFQNLDFVHLAIILQSAQVKNLSIFVDYRIYPLDDSLFG